MFGSPSPQGRDYLRGKCLYSAISGVVMLVGGGDGTQTFASFEGGGTLFPRR
jgi:hypothetical protein